MLKLGAVFVVAAALLAVPVGCPAAPCAGRVVSFAQPDGTVVAVRLFGDELYMRGESLDGYTLVRDRATGWLCYAAISQDGGALVSTGFRYAGGPLPAAARALGLRPRADLSVAARREIARANRARIGGGDARPLVTKEVVGNVKGLVIIVDFEDAPATAPLSAYESMFDDYDYTEYGNLCSVSRFFDEASDGLLFMEHEVFGVFRATKAFAEYDAMPYAEGAMEILGEALAWIDSTGFDFSALTTHEVGGDDVIAAIDLVYTGAPAAWAEGMWPHQGWYNDFSADGVSSYLYACGSANEPLQAWGSMHENGHMMFGWPDTYLYYYYTECTIRSFCIMGGWTDDWNPPPPNPYFRYTAGWVALEDITGEHGTWSSEANGTAIYKWANPENAAEYFLVQARTKDGFSAGIPDEGLTIWRIDEDGDNQAYPQTPEEHFQVDLVHANDVPNQMAGSCYHAGGVDELGPQTSPGSDWWDGSASGLWIHSVSEVGSAMTFVTGELDGGADTDADTDADADADADTDADTDTAAPSGGGGGDDGCGCRAAGGRWSGTLLGAVAATVLRAPSNGARTRR